jgi:hypothetical protein
VVEELLGSEVMVNGSIVLYYRVKGGLFPVSYHHAMVTYAPIVGDTPGTEITWKIAYTPMTFCGWLVHTIVRWTILKLLKHCQEALTHE